MIYITGDKHGDIEFIRDFCKHHPNCTRDDVLIILGDVGFNFYLNREEKKAKKMISKLPITVLCVHGNHEERPYNIKSYKLIDAYGAKAYQEKRYPNILFAKDGEYYSIGDRKFLVIGGAYSTDKYMRLEEGWPWFESEQPSPDIKMHVKETLEKLNYKVDVILSHTCPRKFLYYGIDHSYIDNKHAIDYSTEDWLDRIEDKISYNNWFFGHFHQNRKINNKVYVLYNTAIKIK